MSTARTPAFRFAEPQDIRRCGIKGAGAAALLAAHDIAVPPRPNSVLKLAAPRRGRCLRLGSSEFLLEQDAGGGLIQSITQALADPATQARHALRCDHSVVLHGPALFAALREVAAFDFEALAARPDEAVMTLLAGISVTLILEDDAAASLRLWCDRSYGAYLRDCLLALGGEPSPATFSSPSLTDLQGTHA